MSKSPSPAARALAVIALVCGFLVVAGVVIGSVGSDGDGSSGRGAAAGSGEAGGKGQKPARKAYVVQNGDTLTSIARRTGVSVSRIEDLNPGVDPQILVSGEKLKLR